MPDTGGVSRDHAPSLAPKIAFAALHALIIAVCGWLAFGAKLPDPARAALLFGCAVLYFARHLLTLFVLLKRRVAYSEALGLAAFMAVFEIGFLLLGGGALRGTAQPFGALDAVALGLVLLGSALNSGSELQRWAWKRRPGSTGHCYTGGLFAHSMHINYFGDTVLFTGWAMLTHSALAFAVPLFMAAGFVFYHIPALDAYLAERYGAEFRAYAARTAKFIPYVY
ncbi:methyltransferase family protein [Roseobacteraceae bacterium NS-SX3]